MQEEGGLSRRAKSCRYFAGYYATLPHACNYYPASTAVKEFDGTLEGGRHGSGQSLGQAP
jgi:hypothetical protein